MEMPMIQRPIPRRAFEITPASADSSMPPSPAGETQQPELLRSDSGNPPSRTRSILNLTSSTLVGIYSGATDGGSGQELNTPWGTGAQTPSLSVRQSLDGDRLQLPTFPFDNKTTRRPTLAKITRKTFRNYYLPLITQTVMLFGFGAGFGSLLTHLHKTQQIHAMPVMATNSNYYHIAWGLLGVIIGNALPQIDKLFEDESDEAVAEDFFEHAKSQHVRTTSSTSQSGKDRPSASDSGLGPIWHSAVRSVGAFVGIAFALVSLARCIQT